MISNDKKKKGCRREREINWRKLYLCSIVNFFFLNLSRLRRYFFDRVCGRGYNITLEKVLSRERRNLAVAIRLRKFAKVSLLIAFFISSKKKKKTNKYLLRLLNISLRYQFYARYVFHNLTIINVIIWRLVGFLFFDFN